MARDERRDTRIDLAQQKQKQRRKLAGIRRQPVYARVPRGTRLSTCGGGKAGRVHKTASRKLPNRLDLITIFAASLLLVTFSRESAGPGGANLRLSTQTQTDCILMALDVRMALM